jgi:hypothetical protein
VTGLGGLEPEMHKGGSVWRVKPKSPHTGAISVGSRETPQLSVAGGCRMRERGK